MYTKIACQQKAPKGDKIAPRYCFRARCIVLGRTGNVLGAFVAYDKTPAVGASVMQECEHMIVNFPEGSRYDKDIELVLMTECPVECDESVTYESYTAD